MAKDHFVAQTYLRHWCNPKTGMLHGYSKPAEKEFPCHPKDVCREWNWDINPLFTKNPALLADFRKIFEPQWNPTIGAIRRGVLSAEDKFILSGYWAVLTTCTPTWHGNAVEVFEHQLRDVIPLAAEHAAQKFPENRQYIEKAVAEGKIVPNVDPDHIKAILTRQLTDATITLYQQDWTILKNITEVPFITSDNPSCVFPGRPINAPLTRFLPLGPDLAIIAVMDRTKIRHGYTITDLSSPPPGKIRSRLVDRRRIVAQLNRVTVMNADQLVLSITKSKALRRLVRNHRRFGIGVEHMKFRTPDGYINGSTLVVRQKRKA
jgi:hypothetical protein